LIKGVIPLEAPWPVRIRNADDILGAGILVCGGRVLTCAHVISRETSETPPDTTVTVDFVGLPDCPPATARILDGCWFPPQEHEWLDDQGDVVLLELADGRKADLPAAPLRRLPVSLRGRRVFSWGYPDGAEKPGVRATADLAPGPGERVQLDSVSMENPVTCGFSGAGVVDDKTNTVIGMVVSEYTKLGVAWMLPVETILRHLPGIKDCVHGGLAVDRELSDRPGSQIDVAFARQIASWLWGRRRIRLIVTGDSASTRSAALRRVIRFADRESRPSAADRSLAEAADGTVPPVGSVDLALDASGKTVDEISRRIADRLGIPIDEPRAVTSELRTQAAPMTLVVDGVDDVTEPAALLNEVLAPLAERGVRLLLGFHRESSDALRIARSRWPDQDKPDDHPAVIQRRLDTLTSQIGDFADREDALSSHRERVAARIADPPKVQPRGASLRLRLSALRKDNANGERAGLQSHLDDCEAAVERAFRRLDELQRQLEKLWEQHRELTRRLRAYHAMAVDYDLVEDPDLDTVYRQAHEALRHGPADLAVAERLLDTYQRAVRRKVDGMHGE
jgi:hypothetical protein